MTLATQKCTRRTVVSYRSVMAARAIGSEVALKEWRAAAPPERAWYRLVRFAQDRMVLRVAGGCRPCIAHAHWTAECWAS